MMASAMLCLLLANWQVNQHRLIVTELTVVQKKMLDHGDGLRTDLQIVLSRHQLWLHKKSSMKTLDQ